MSAGQRNISAFVLMAVGVVLVGVSLFFYIGNDDVATNEVTFEDVAEDAAAPVVSDGSVAVIDVDAALAPRSVGADDAPITIMEFASLSCTHCAQFHGGVFKEIQEKYIDTGKVRVVFSDFPLNRPALQGTMIARCLPADQYLPFVTELFATQEEWAFVENSEDKLKEKALAYGMSDDVFDACLASEELSAGIIRRVESAHKRWDVTSTPTFVVNNTVTINGGQPLAAFEAAFDTVLSGDESVIEGINEAEGGIEAETDTEAEADLPVEADTEDENVSETESTTEAEDTITE